MSKPVALVTGGSSGIGEATARAFLAKGFTVYAVARRVERMSNRHDLPVHHCRRRDEIRAGRCLAHHRAGQQF